MKRSHLIAILAVQCLLLGIELLTRYDTLIRQLALASTNILATAMLVIILRRFQQAGRLVPPAAAWLAVAGVWFDAAGNFANLYASIVWWDKLAHLVGTAALATGLWLVLEAVCDRRSIRLTAFQFGLSVLGFAMLLAVLYEISEYLGDLVVATHRVTDFYDTADDLLWDLLAALAVICLMPKFRRRN